MKLQISRKVPEGWCIIATLFLITFLSTHERTRDIIFLISLFVVGLLLLVFHKCDFLYPGKEILWFYGLIAWQGIGLVVNHNVQVSGVLYLGWIYTFFLALYVGNLLIKRNKILEDYQNFFIAYIILNFILSRLKNVDIFFWHGGFNGIEGRHTVGTVMMFAIPVFAEKAKNRRGIFLIWISAAVSFIFYANATTSIFFALAVLILCIIPSKIFQWILKNWLILFFCFFFAFCGYLFCFEKIITSVFNDMFQQIVGKDLSFTGRSNLWFYALEIIKKRLFAGYGYQGAWYDQELLNISMENLGYRMNGGHAHSSYLQLLTDGGLIGLVLLMVMLFYIWKSYIRGNREVPRFEAIWFLVISFGSYIYTGLLGRGFYAYVFVYLLLRAINFKKQNHKKIVYVLKNIIHEKCNYDKLMRIKICWK